MNQAEYWTNFCLEARPNAKLHTDLWIRRILIEVSTKSPEPCGINGWKWSFDDGSALIVTANKTYITQ